MKRVAGIICLVKDLNEITDFYETLGFEFKKKVPEISATAYLNGFWIEFLLEDKVVTEDFKEDLNVNQKGAGQYIHINVEGIDNYYQYVIGSGLKPLSEPQDYPWGHREFVIKDPAGYKLVFFSKLK